MSLALGLAMGGAMGLTPRFSAASDKEDRIRAFLEAHPEFLLEHPELVDKALAEHQSREGKARAVKRLEAIEALKAFSGIARTDAASAPGYQVVFFGFTHCPDICPTALFSIAQTLSLLGETAGRVHPLFISVDPERDDARAVADYVAYFGAGFTGVTGSRELLDTAQEAFAVRSEKIVAGAGGEETYVFNHSSWIFLLDGDGQILTRFSANSDPGAMARSILRFMDGENG